MSTFYEASEVLWELLGNLIHALRELYDILACKDGLVTCTFFGQSVNFMLPCWDGEQFKHSGAILVKYRVDCDKFSVLL